MKLLPSLSLFLALGLQSCMLPMQAAEPDSSWSLHVLDVGQGSAALLVRDSVAILLDAGPADEPALGRWLRTHPDTRILAVLVSHWDADHWGGLDTLFRWRAQVGVLWSPRPPRESWLRMRYAQYCRQSIHGCEEARPGQILSVAPALEARVLWPDSAVRDTASNNAASLSTLWCDRRRPSLAPALLLAPGDIDSTAIQRLLAKKDASLAADVLLVPHHGSASSRCRPFLQAVSPRMAVISCGKNNDYGHPHQEILGDLRRLRIPAWITAEVGGFQTDF